MVATPSSVAFTSALHLDLQEVSHHLAAAQRQARVMGQAQLVSVLLPTPDLDPLAVLQTVMASPDMAVAAPGQYLYLEKPWQAEATAVWEPLIFQQFQGSQRFAQAKQFIQTWQSRIHTVGAKGAPQGLGGRFFGSFSFSHDTPGSAPFAAATLFLPRWQLSRCQGQHWLVCHLLIQPDTDLLQACTQLQAALQRFPLDARLDNTTSHPPNHGFSVPLDVPLEAPRFKQAVAKSLQAIAAKQFAKLVLAHALDVATPKPVDIFQSLAQLRRRYPDCYIFSINNGQGQTFLGASPERLLSLQTGELIVDALAGSAPRGQTPLEDLALAQRLLNSDKERREHQVLVDYIVSTLQALGLTAQPVTPTRLLPLANIQHLQTLIQADVTEQLHLLDILAQLHPTPAVAGFPRAIACEQIRQYEPFERGLYAAPLGWMDPQGNGEFVVGLRSALVDGQQVRLYAGAGIVAGSNPDRELQEIQLKLRVLLESLVWS
jgi:menaquinone-specific isochorismate synthase